MARRGLWDVVLDTVFPPRCVGCGRWGRSLCDNCLGLARPIYPPLCRICGRPSSPGPLCPFCQETPLGIDGIRSVYLFQGVIRQAIHNFKYRGLSSLARPLGQLLARYLRDNPLPGDVIVPVPLHPQRLRERGYNQAELLARELAGQRPLGQGYLVRLHHTRPQVRTANSRERRNNVRGAFSSPPALAAGKGIILVDDVCTTGATLEACARALKEAGASSVWGLTLAREG